MADRAVLLKWDKTGLETLFAGECPAIFHTLLARAVLTPASPHFLRAPALRRAGLRGKPDAAVLRAGARGLKR